MKSLLLKALKEKGHSPLQIVGVPNALVALIAEDVGFKTLYLSGAGFSSGSFAIPDLGMLSLEMIIEESWRITDASQLPLIVDIDTGWDHPLILERAAKRLTQIQVAGVQIEDQILAKRCGHREGKKLVSSDTMCERVAVLKKADTLFIVARTDALAVEGLEKAIERANAYVKAGADMIFVEAVTTTEELKELKKSIKAPLMINMTEFGKTPPFSKEETKGIDALLYPVSVARAMYKTAKGALVALKEGRQKELIDEMMTRDEIYRLIHYEEKERQV